LIDQGETEQQGSFTQSVKNTEKCKQNFTHSRLFIYSFEHNILINKSLNLHGTCFAKVVVTMHHNKDTQKEIIVIEAIVWTFWLLIFAVSYLLAKETI
jgi:hypothetical protein